jgi:hypothetical protein
MSDWFNVPKQSIAVPKRSSKHKRRSRAFALGFAGVSLQAVRALQPAKRR